VRALIREGGTVRLVEVPRPQRREDQALIRVIVVGICRTDLHVAAGKVPCADPITLGHELFGRVIDAGAAGPLPGTPVTVNPAIGEGFLGVTHHGAFADEIVVPISNLHVLPELDPRAGAYVEPVAAALAVPEAIFDHAARAAVAGPAWRVGVAGDNRFAALVARVLEHEGFTVQPIDGASSANQIDVGVETTGTAEELAMLVDAVVPGGLVILKSRNPAPVALPIGVIVAKRIAMLGVRYGSFERAIELVGELDLRALFGDTLPIERWEEAFARARAGEASKLFLRLGDDPCVA